jgi:hypothetical protein
MLRAHDGESGTWLDLSPAAHVTALAFASNGRDIAVADSKPASVSVLRNIEAISGITPVVTGTDGLATPSAVRFGNDSRMLIATASGVTIVQLNDNTRFDIACGCVPTALEELDGIFTFRVTDLTREPLWLLNESTDGLQLVFVPPPVQPEPSQEPVQ